jgi:hypothetical protein
MGIEVTPLALSGVSQLLRTGIVNYRGFGLRETAGATATVRFWDGTTPAGTILDTVKLSANESARELYPDGIRAAVGLYCEIVAGAVEGSARVG